MAISKKRLKEVETIEDKNIDFSDIPELTDEFWNKAELKMPEAKEGVFIRLDGDVLSWFRGQGRGYQTRINSILRAYYESQKN